ncbi:alpha/beta fold hydrolase [Candidatus Bathyarchaeota archaeon]|nr:alpha/beta fold hydrolase [Candidatus Bathyarchaeota archaeon]
MGQSIIVEDVVIPSDDVKLRGRVYRPSEEGRYPAVALCHGYPGDTKNMDLAEEVALNGVAVLIFYYQGAWGSEGVYEFTRFAPSTVNALKYLRALPYVDPQRVGLIGHSMGALPLTRCMANDSTLKTGILMSPASDLKVWSEGPALDSIVPVFLTMAEGKLTGWNEARLRESIKFAASELNPIDAVKRVCVPLLVILGTSDNVTLPRDIRRLYEAANEPKKLVEIEGADHGFSEHRIPLQKVVVEWLASHL